MAENSKKRISRELTNLPLEIIIMIFTYLTVKSLITLKCVSKSFFNLISSAEFIKNHLKLSLSDPTLDNFKLIFSSVHPRLDLASCSLQPVLNFQYVNATELDYPSNDPLNLASVVGSFNGLVCIAIDEEILYIWNPSTMVSRRLPDSGLEIPDESTIIYTFAFEERNDDYKVVGIFCLWFEIEVKLYSLRSDSWKTLGIFPGGCPEEKPGKFANGALHWVVIEGVSTNGSPCVIISLDLTTETYGEIQQPDYGKNISDVTIGVLHGKICVLSDYQGVCSELWIMNEYGAQNSWARLCVIPYVGDAGIFWYSFPIWISSSGELLMEFRRRLVLYNPSDRTFTYPEVDNLNEFLDADTYVESLVSPYFDDPVLMEE